MKGKAVGVLGKKNLSIVASFILALAAALLVFASVKAMQPSVPVVVAARTLSVGDQIGPADVAVKNMPAAAVSKSALRDKSQAVGKTVAYGPILAGEVVRQEHLLSEGSLLAELRSYAPQGWAAVELPPDTALGMTGLRRGDKVDIYGEVPYGDGSVVSLVARAIVLENLSGERSESKRYVVAVPQESAPALAELTVRGKKLTLVLPSEQSEKAAPENQQSAAAGAAPGGIQGEAADTGVSR